MPYSFDNPEFIRRNGPQAGRPSAEEQSASRDIAANEDHQAEGGQGYSEDDIPERVGQAADDESES